MTSSQASVQGSPADSGSPTLPVPVVPSSGPRRGHETPNTRLTNEKAAVLEFLAYGRRGVLNHLGGSPEWDAGDGTGKDVSVKTRLVSWDPLFSVDEARHLLVLHQGRLAWMHNAVHMPSFINEFDAICRSGYCDKSWLALYYGILSVRLP